MKVAAVVVRWRGGDEIRRCLGSLLDHGGPSLVRVVLVDSGSGDGGADRLAREYPSIEVVGLAENRSFAWAANQGAERCPEPYLLLLNPDAELVQGCVPQLVELLESKPRIAGVVPLLTDPDGRPQHHWQLRKLPGRLRLSTGRNGAAAFTSESLSGPAPVEQPAAASWLVRRSVWAALNGLDRAFAPAWWEDVDFCARLSARLVEPDFPADEGFWVEPRARVNHSGGSSLANLTDAAFLSAFNRNLLRYAERHHPDGVRMIRVGVRISLLTRAVLNPSRRDAYFKAIRSL
jgi:GT2 family glycosyltransferase